MSVKGTYQPAANVREMFGRIAPRYDFLNHALSFNIDKLWRRAVSREFAAILARPGARVLDLCCGTGDLAMELRSRGNATVIGADFCHPMLVRAIEKSSAYSVLEADALCLPFTDESFDLITVAFGFRNLTDYDAGLREMRRLLRPGGCVGILEFSDPSGAIFGPIYRAYSKYILPRLGGAISGDASAYTYLPASISRFPAPDELAARMAAAGLRDAHFRRFTFGAVCLHIGGR